MFILEDAPGCFGFVCCLLSCHLNWKKVARVLRCWLTILQLNSVNILYVQWESLNLGLGAVEDKVVSEDTISGVTRPALDLSHKTSTQISPLSFTFFMFPSKAPLCSEP